MIIRLRQSCGVKFPYLADPNREINLHLKILMSG